MKISFLGALFLTACLGSFPRRPVPPAVAPPVAPIAPPALLSPDGHSLAPVSPDRLPDFRDDGGLSGFRDAVTKSVDYYRGLPAGASFLVGSDRVSAVKMAAALEELLESVEAPPAEFKDALNRLFKVYQSPGTDNRGTVTFSAYYEHTLDASLTRGGIYQYPLYGRPADLLEKDDPRGKTVGRLQVGAWVPYYSRREIDLGGALEGRGLEIAWAADPIDIFYLQVQGSGWLTLPGESNPLRVRFAGHNGLPYVSVGGSLISKGLIPKEKFSRKAMEDYFRTYPEERLDLLSVNPRYVFFSLDRGPNAPFAIGSIRQPLTPRRSAAADKAIFPPGALAWMETEKPRTTRFIVIQDEGGAIKGPGRIDYFMGAGQAAEEDAVRFWTPGRLYVLVPR